MSIPFCRYTYRDTYSDFISPKSNTFIRQQLSFSGECGLTHEEKVDNTPFEEEVEVVSSLLDEVSEFGCTHEENVDIASETIVVVVLVAAAAVVLVEQAPLLLFHHSHPTSVHHLLTYPNQVVELHHSFVPRSLLVHASSLVSVI